MPNGKAASAASPGQGYVLVRHMARSPRTRTMRAARSGHRRQGVLLDDGTRIRKKGRKRFTQVELTTMVNNHQRLLEYLRVGTLEACDPVTERPMSYQEVADLIRSLGATKGGFALDESGVQQGPVGGSEKPENAAPSAKKKKPPPQVDQDAPPQQGHTEGELFAMRFDELKEVAVNIYGVDSDAVSSMRAKKEVVAAIFAQGEE